MMVTKQQNIVNKKLLFLKKHTSIASNKNLQNATNLPTIIKITTTNGAYITQENKQVYLHSARNPKKEAQRQATKFLQSHHPALNTENTIIIILGIAAGYHIQAISNILPQNIQIIVIDLQPRAVLDTLPILPKTIPNIKQNSKFIISEDIAEIWTELYTIIHDKLSSNIIFWLPPTIKRTFSTPYTQLKQRLQEYIRLAMINWLTMATFCKLWTVNTIANFANIIQAAPIQHLKNIFKHKPAIIVAAGPNLDQQLPILKKMQNKAIIITAGRAIPALLEAGITPHLAVDIDPQEIIYTRIQKYKTRLSQTHLVAPYYIPAKLPTIFSKPYFCFTNNACSELNLWLESYTTKPHHLHTGSTVILTTLNLAIYLGCTTIICFGLDLCYTKDRTRHAKQCQYKNEKKIDKTKLIEVKGNWTANVITSKTLKNYIADLNIYAESIKQQNPKYTILNLNSGGAKIATIPAIKPEQLKINQYPNIPTPSLKIKEQINHTKHSPEQIKTYLQKEQKQLQQFLQECIKILKKPITKQNTSQIINTFRQKRSAWLLIISVLKNKNLSLLNENKQINHEQIIAYQQAAQWLITQFENILEETQK